MIFEISFFFFQERQVEAAMQCSHWECVVCLTPSGCHGSGSGTTCDRE